MSDPGDDEVIQHALQQSVASPLAGPGSYAAAAAAWAALDADLSQGGWIGLHRQAAVVSAPTRPAPEPGEVLVTMIWSGSRPITGPADRHRSTARAIPAGSGHWQIQLLD